MTKICVCDGHSKGSPGTSGFLDEFEAANAYVKHIASALEAAGYDVVTVLDGPGNENAELAEKVEVANSSGCDWFLDVHFNSGGGTGTECYYWGGSEKGEKMARIMSANVASALGIRDRGAKTGKFYVLRNTVMPAVLLETLFVDSKTDVEAWNSTSWDELCGAIVDSFKGVIRTPGEDATVPKASVLENDEYKVTIERK